MVLKTEQTDTVRIGLIGLGPRAETLLATMFQMDGEVRVSAICDLRSERVEHILGIFERNNHLYPEVFHDYRELIASPEVDAVLVPTSWNCHLAIAGDAMRHGKYAGIEVGGASSAEELWKLVHTAEETGASCMMLENACYGRAELMVSNMVEQGLFGELIHCQCGYEHYIAERMPDELEQGIERAWHNFKRNCDLYPTHGIGPIARILKINRGNRFVSLTSTASKACGFAAAAAKQNKNLAFAEGDIITSVIKCANGETITVTHGISLPRPYSRNMRVQGTGGIWSEDAKGIYIEGISPRCRKLDIAGNPYEHLDWTPTEEFYPEYEHEIWRRFRSNPIGGHDGVDALVLREFFDAVRSRGTPPIDVYDCAAWMSITFLSEQSIALGSMPVPFPDFTNGKWIKR